MFYLSSSSHNPLEDLRSSAQLRMKTKKEKENGWMERIDQKLESSSFPLPPPPKKNLPKYNEALERKNKSVLTVNQGYLLTNNNVCTHLRTVMTATKKIQVPVSDGLISGAMLMKL